MAAWGIDDSEILDLSVSLLKKIIPNIEERLNYIEKLREYKNKLAAERTLAETGAAGDQLRVDTVEEVQELPFEPVHFEPLIENVTEDETLPAQVDDNFPGKPLII